MRIIILALLVLVTNSCSHSVHLVNISDHEPFAKFNQGDIVKSKEEQTVFLGFVTNTGYVNKARNKLLKKCTHGKIQGISTKYYTSHGFLSWTNTIPMSGLCVKNQ